MAGTPPPKARTRLTPAQLAILLVVAGVAGRIALVRVANVETVLAATMLAGVLLRGWYAAAVPLAIMAMSDAAIYAAGLGAGFGLNAILGLSAFTWSGFLIVSAISRQLDRSRILFTVRSIAVLTTISIPATIAYDLWTDVGEWLFIAGPRGLTFVDVLLLQLPFTLVHIGSSLLFVPLFGTIFVWLHSHDMPTGRSQPAPLDGHAPEVSHTGSVAVRTSTRPCGPILGPRRHPRWV